MSTSSLPRAGTKRAGWFANRPLSVKFGILVGVVLIAFGSVLLSVLNGNGPARDANTELEHVATAAQLGLQLDTRASQPKGDGYEALGRADPAHQRAGLA